MDEHKPDLIFLWREENQLESWPMLLEMVIKLGAAIPERLGNAELKAGIYGILTTCFCLQAPCRR